MHGDELGAVGKSCLDLNVVDHLGDALHDLAATENACAVLHQLRDAAAVTCPFENEIGDEGHGFGVVEFDATLQATARHHRRHGNKQLVFFSRCQS